MIVRRALITSSTLLLNLILLLLSTHRSFSTAVRLGDWIDEQPPAPRTTCHYLTKPHRVAEAPRFYVWLALADGWRDGCDKTLTDAIDEHCSRQHGAVLENFKIAPDGACKVYFEISGVVGLDCVLEALERVEGHGVLPGQCLPFDTDGGCPLFDPEEMQDPM